MHYTVNVERSDMTAPRYWSCYKPASTEEDHRCKNRDELLIEAYRQVLDLDLEGKYDPDYFGAHVLQVLMGAERDKKRFGKENITEFGAYGMDSKSFLVSDTTRISVAVWIRE
ncbi:hypothetical protein [Stenotrophomonas phage IME-SM1]|uniref:Uncharacterized protein n=1 Tax=Stenotrophomonas phage IME-SM1 TaxID=1654717 RepID=A0A0H4IS91_9CAUD|nr:hypothetical protein KMC40_gp177 [Stenotrophomonas phage IME-SM1]AKO61581.1 hypothetical protein [Stenotrophomonas phage IME-SM1]